MKYFLKLLMAIFLIGFYVLGMQSCSKKVAVPAAEVYYVSTVNKTITLNAVGYGKKPNAAIISAEKNAFDKLLFVGIPGSPFQKPLITQPKAGVMSKHAEYFEHFFGEQGYRKFITSSKQLTAGMRDRKSKKVRTKTEITINFQSLRKDLEQNGILHKFGL